MNPRKLLGLLLAALCTWLAFLTYGAPAALLIAVITINAAAFAAQTNPFACGVTNNSFGTLASSGILYGVLREIVRHLPMIRNMATDIAPDGAKQYVPFNIQQILKNFNADQTVYDRATTGTYDIQAGVTFPADQTFTLTQWPFIALRLSAIEINQMVSLFTTGTADQRNGVIESLLRKGMNKLGQSIVARLYTVLTAANYTNGYAISAATMDYKKLGSAADQLFVQDQLQSPNAILDVLPYRNLINSLTPIANYSGVDEAVGTGGIERPVSGVANVSRYNVAMPSDAANGFLFLPDGVVFANRPPIEETLEGRDPVFLETITEPETGFSVLYREFKNPSTGEVTRNLTTMFDFAPGVKSNVLRITES